MERIIFFTFVSFILTSSLAFADDNSLVRVRLFAGQTSFRLEGEGVSLNGHAESIRPISLPKISRWIFRPKKIQGRVLWQAQQIYPTSQSLFFNSTKPLIISGYNLRSGNQFLQGALNLTGTKEGRFDIISFVPLRVYLVGVLNGEMPKDWPLDTLKAQAVAARSYVESVRRERKNMAFDVESDHRDQVYSSGVPQVFGNTLSLQERAVFETKNMILSHNHEPLKAYFHADCGGEPASAASVWGQEQKNNPSASMCYSQRQSTWNYQISQPELFAKIKILFPAFNEKLFKKFQWLHQPQHHRVSEVKIVMNDGKSFQLRSQEFREALGYGNLKSTLFEVQNKNNIYFFTGKGYGHGVGLCQHGAQAMAQVGKKFQQILSHYYPTAQLIYQTPEPKMFPSRGLSSIEL